MVRYGYISETWKWCARIAYCAAFQSPPLINLHTGALCAVHCIAFAPQFVQSVRFAIPSNICAATPSLGHTQCAIHFASAHTFPTLLTMKKWILYANKSVAPYNRRHCHYGTNKQKKRQHSLYNLAVSVHANYTVIYLFSAIRSPSETFTVVQRAVRIFPSTQMNERQNANCIGIRRGECLAAQSNNNNRQTPVIYPA